MSVAQLDESDVPIDGQFVAERKFKGTHWRVHSLDMQWDLAGSIDDVIELSLIHI